MIANTAVYRDGSKLEVEAAPDDLDGIRKAVQSGPHGGFVSVGLHEPDEAEMARVAKIFGLHRLAVEDALHPVQRPKLEKYGDMVFLVLRTLWYVKESDTVEGGQVALYMGPDYVVTVRQGAQFELESVRHELERHTDVLEQGPCAVVYAVCDRVVDVYEDVVSELQADVDDVEDSVFSGERIDASKRIYELNRELTTMRRAFEPLQSPMHQFAQAEIDGVSSDAAAFFRDVADHLARVSDAVGALDSQLSSAFDANLSRIGVQQNDDMRRMSAWAAIAAVVTVLAGIYGMNFVNMPELRWSFGYPGLVLVMAVLAMWLYRKFKKAGWL
ncbi:MAG TPA: magnesium and cobalt transport protein CorA [Acidimicrobiales bacterium]|nr:magnesium and cobalt transport protein CorA [Acidimicrobiales bacterium]